MTRWLIAVMLVTPSLALAQRYTEADGTVRVAPINMPYSGARNVPELSGGPDYLEEGGVVQFIEELGATVKEIPTVALTAEEDNDASGTASASRTRTSVTTWPRTSARAI